MFFLYKVLAPDVLGWTFRLLSGSYGCWGDSATGGGGAARPLLEASPARKSLPAPIAFAPASPNRQLTSLSVNHIEKFLNKIHHGALCERTSLNNSCVRPWEAPNSSDRSSRRKAHIATTSRHQCFLTSAPPKATLHPSFSRGLILLLEPSEGSGDPLLQGDTHFAPAVASALSLFRGC
ncbi:hypothetical protein KSP40_PGU013209 [Platanthera guangdongensis]|uniref:Uncharacterized protein n=1 Tax=Platanthera guangdongensis TaxID=2320717 RepID=A0ABR2MS29_9ASPA